MRLNKEGNNRFLHQNLAQTLRIKKELQFLFCNSLIIKLPLLDSNQGPSD